jgi:ribosomal protein S16
VVVDNEKVARWLRDGAKPTDTVARLLAQSGALEEFKTGAAQAKS